MKKKKSASAKSPASDGPRKVGGTRHDAAQANWIKLGRTLGRANEPVVAFGTAMKAAREEQGLSVSQLAKKLDIAPATMIKFEDRGHPISILIVLRLADALGYDLQLRKRRRSK